MCAALALLAALSCAAPDETRPKPPSPELAAVAAAFKAPTGTLSQQDAAGALQGVLELGQRLRELDFQVTLRPMMEALGQASTRASMRAAGVGDGPPGLGVQAFGVDGEGWLQITRICNGWGARPAPDPANGALRLQVGFTEQGLDPVIWGKAESCRYATSVDGARRIELDGSDSDTAVAVYLGGPAPFDGLSDLPVVVSLRVRVTVDDEARDLAADFRIDPGADTLDFLVPVADGDLIVSLLGVDRLTLRAANGDYECDTAQRTCTRPDGETLRL